MAEDKPFLARWSARKRQAREVPVEAVPVPVEPEAVEPEADFDPASLPPVESLGPGSDIAAFLRKGVPAALRRAALRRIWVADPKISNFREVADYDWDFNAPGYGALLPTDNAQQAAERLLAGVQRAAPKEVEPAAVEEPVAAPMEPVVAEEGGELAALPVEPEPADPEPPGPEWEPEPVGRRRHGGATPR